MYRHIPTHLYSARTSFANARSRPGAILIVVLALLALFAVIGISFVFYADTEANAAKIFREAQSTPTVSPPDPTTALNTFLGTAIFDVPDSDLINVLRGKSLVRNMYGWGGVAGQNNTPFNGVGTFHDQVTVPGGSGMTDRALLVNCAPCYLSGSTAFGLDPEWTGVRSVTNNTTFNAAPTFSNLMGRTYIGQNAGYTYPDLNNLFLGSISPATGEVLVQSYYRDWAFKGGFTGQTGLDPANPNWTNAVGRLMILRPRPQDQTLDSGDGRGAVSDFPYPTQNVDLSYTGDVQNLPGGVGPQKNDSLWLDVGLAPFQWNGKWIKPLVAPLILDLDGRINLSAHGNVRNNGNHISYAGYGPWEVNLGAVLSTADSNNVVKDRYSGNITSRNGVSTRYYDPSQTPLPAYSLVDWDGTGSGGIQIPGVNGVSGFYTASSYQSGSGGFSDDAPNMTVNGTTQANNHPALFNPAEWPAGGTSPQTYPLSDSRHLHLRYADQLSTYKATTLAGIANPPNSTLIGTSTAPPNVTQTTANSYRLDQAHPNRLLTTVFGATLDRPGLMPNFTQINATGNSLNLFMPTPSTTPNPAPADGYTAGQDYYSNPLGKFRNDNQFLTTFPNTTATNFSTTTGDFRTGQYRHAQGGIGPVDINRPLTDYRQSGSTAPLSSTVVTNQSALSAWVDRQNLARDIFARLIVSTGANATVALTAVAASGNTPMLNPGDILINATPGSADFLALQNLAQIAANIVDAVDADDVSTIFIWNPNGFNTSNTPTPLTRIDTTNTWQKSITTELLIRNCAVFGVEKPRLVINEALSEIVNDPAEQTTGPLVGMPPSPSAPTLPNHVRFWVELLNPTSPPYASTNTGDLGDGSVVLYDANGKFSPYKLVIVRANKDKSNTWMALENPTNPLYSLGNSRGSLSQYNGATVTPITPDINCDFSTATQANPNTVKIMPNNGQYNPNGQPSQGIAVVGPQIPTSNPAAGPQSFEYAPNATTEPYATNIIQTGPASGPIPTLGSITTPGNGYNAMEYLISTKGANAAANANFPQNGTSPPVTAAELADPQFQRHLVLLRRLANPYLPPNDPEEPGFTKGNPVNPYMTVDYMDYVPANNAVGRVSPAAGVTAPYPAGSGVGTVWGQNTTQTPPPISTTNPPNGYTATSRMAMGKVQPYAGYSPVPSAANAASPTPMSYSNSLVLAQNPTPAPTATTLHTLGRHNGQSTMGTTYTAASTALPQTVGETIVYPFDMLIHFDRPLANQLELLQVQGGKPHNVTQDFNRPTPAYPNTNPTSSVRKDAGLIPWLGLFANPTGNTYVNQTNTGLYRALDLLRARPFGYGVGLGGKIHGRVNANTIQDQRLFTALLDPQQGNQFNTSDVNNLYTQWIGSRTSVMSSRTSAGGTSYTVPVPGRTLDDDPANGTDRPFKSFGVAEFSSGGSLALNKGSGIQDTMLRLYPDPSDNTSRVPMLWLDPTQNKTTFPNRSIPYLRAEAARKLINNVTTVSNTFEVYLTVGYFEVRTNSSGAIATEPATNRPLLGKEAYIQVPGDIRQQYYAIIDRNNVVSSPPATTRPYFIALNGAAAAGTNTITVDGAAMNGNTAVAYVDGTTVNITGTLYIGVGAEQETVTFSKATAGPANSGQVVITLNGNLAKSHTTGELVTNAVLGNPGPQTGFTYGNYPAVVPYVVRTK